MLLRTCWALIALTPAIALAQTPGDQELIRDRQERLLQEQQKRLNELRYLPGEQPSAPLAPAAPGACFDIGQIELSGAERLRGRARQRLLQPFLNQCLGVAQLNQLLKVVTDYYLDRGYSTTRAYLPQQDLGDGTLDVIVIEGRLEGLDSSTLASERELAMSFPGQVGEVLDLRELEQLVDQLARLPSRQAELELIPGEEVGGSRVQLKGERSKPWRVSLNRHNDGQRSTGEHQWGIGVEWDSPLGLADQFGLRGGIDAVSDRWRHSASQGLYYSVPYGWWSFSYNYSHSYYRTQ